jgi:hypothetical protein
MSAMTSPPPEAVLLEGSARLGAIMGTFHYQATATDTDFVAWYRSRNDHGKFTLQRTCDGCR